MSRLERILTPRPSWVREVMDPDGTLPDISFKGSGATYCSTDGSTQVQSYGIYLHETPVGSARIARQGRGGAYNFSWIALRDPRDRLPKGTGLAAYMTAIEAAHEQRRPWTTDAESLSGDAVRIWTRFIEAGVAEVVEPFKPLERPGVETVYTGAAFIPPHLRFQ